MKQHEQPDTLGTDRDPAAVIEAIAEVLWPSHDPQEPWDADTIEAVAEVMEMTGNKPARAYEGIE